MLRLTGERQAKGLSKLALSYRTQVPSGTRSQIKSGRFKPGPPQLQRLARALGFEGDPAFLLDETDGVTR